MLAAENIQRQVTVALVVPVEEAPLLLAVQRIVGRVQIQDDLFGRRRVRLKEKLHKQMGRFCRIDSDLLIAICPGLLRHAQLQPIQRTLACERSGVLVRSVGEHRQQRIVAQIIVVVEILVPERQSIHALREQLAHRVLHPVCGAMVLKARRELLHNACATVYLTQQHCAAVGSDRTAIKTPHDFAAILGVKMNAFSVTLCFQWANLLFGVSVCEHTYYTKEDGPLKGLCEKSGLEQ